MNRISIKILLALSILSVSVATYAAPVYLNIDNISVSVGDGTSPGSFNNTFDGGNTVDKVIDAPTADAEEFHNQSTHFWFTASQIGGGLELDFDFGQAYDITTLHFWNYTGEAFDVDSIEFTFFNSNSVLVGSLLVEPDLGSSPGISAQDIELDAPLNIEFVTAFLTGSNAQVDFQNIGFTAQASVVPVPAALWLLMSGLGAFAAFRTKSKNTAS